MAAIRPCYTSQKATFTASLPTASSLMLRSLSVGCLKKSCPVSANTVTISPNQQKRHCSLLEQCITVSQKRKGVKQVNHIPDNNTQMILAESDEPKVTATITKHVHTYCPYCYDDPQTGATDQCSKLSDIHDIHCVAIDSPYSHVEKGVNECKVFNSFPAMVGIQVSSKADKVCAFCHKRFVPASNRQRYCNACTGQAKQRAANARQRAFKARKK